MPSGLPPRITTALNSDAHLRMFSLVVVQSRQMGGDSLVTMVLQYKMRYIRWTFKESMHCSILKKAAFLRPVSRFPRLSCSKSGCRGVCQKILNWYNNWIHSHWQGLGGFLYGVTVKGLVLWFQSVEIPTGSFFNIWTTKKKKKSQYFFVRYELGAAFKRLHL